MTHEFIEIVEQAIANQKKGLKNVLATVVHLEGSSYRKPGVRMLISADMKMTGAVSGGCVEAELRRRAKSVFKDNQSKMMTYDGRYRLGCEGTLYILLEPFYISDEVFQKLENCLNKRTEFTIESYYKLEDEATGNFASQILVDHNTILKLNNVDISTEFQLFSQVLKPNMKLLIIGAEHDAVKLCQMASHLGWEVTVISALNDSKEISDFPGAKSVMASSPELLEISLDQETVIMLMTHSFTRDLKYLVKLSEFQPKYLGILGSRKRRDQLQNDLYTYKEDISEEFLEAIFSPAGLNIGAITPAEIAISILSEILAILREKEPSSLRKLTGNIHN
ncbi:MAG: XdhC family protein [bacterium]